MIWNDLGNGKCTWVLEIWMWALGNIKVSEDSLQRMREVEITFGGSVGRKLGQGRHWQIWGLYCCIWEKEMKKLWL